MMAEHGNPCYGQEATFCMNGGTCYKIPSMDILSCVCNKDYKGSRCEEYQLPSKGLNVGDAGLVAAMICVALLILVVLAVIIYYTHKLLKAKRQVQQNTQQQYWRVTPRE